MEEALHEIEDRAIALQTLFDLASAAKGADDAQMFSGLADMVEDIATLARRTRDCLDVPALGTEVKG